MTRFGQEVFRFVLVVFLFIPALIAGLNNAQAGLMRQVQQIGQPHPAVAAPINPNGVQTPLSSPK